MATVIPFPARKCVRETPEPSLREILMSRGIEPTGDERRRKRREQQARKQKGAPPTKEGS